MSTQQMRTDVEERQQIVEVARAYYVDDKPKTQIATELGLSRFKVARLLERARAEGIVRITIQDGVLRDANLAEELQEHLQLEDVEVVAGAETETANREALARAAAAYLRRNVQPGDTFGFSWGRTLASIGGFMELLPQSTLVALTGAVGTDFAQSPVDVIRRVAGRSQVRTMSIFAPMFVDSAATAEGLRKDPSIKSVLASYEHLGLAVLSIGSWDPPITQLLQSLTEEDKRQLDAAQVRAEVVGIFIRDDGRPFDAPATQRRISITAEQLIHVPRVLAVAGGRAKVPALAAVARSRLLTSLITDEQTARLLLTQEPVAPGPRELPRRFPSQ